MRTRSKPRFPSVKIVRLWAAAIFFGSFPRAALASGHGPVYGLATPTLGQGGWSVDVAAMYRLTGDLSDQNAQRAMLRAMLGYGITENLEVSLSVPMPLHTPSAPVPSLATRMMAMMPSTQDVEGVLSWRFHRNDNDVGSRIESTAFLGFDYPTDSVRSGIRTAPGFVTGAVTGYASRTVYAWVGGLYQRYMTPTTNHLGDMVLYSLVLGYRPPFFREELPHADWRVFIEGIGEYQFRNVVGGNEVADSGGHQIFVGPTVLGLYGPWGISGGPLFPIYRNLNGNQRADRFRFAVNFTYWF
jgi:hypothetical protein